MRPHTSLAKSTSENVVCHYRPASPPGRAPRLACAWPISAQPTSRRMVGDFSTIKPRQMWRQYGISRRRVTHEAADVGGQALFVQVATDKTNDSGNDRAPGWWWSSASCRAAARIWIGVNPRRASLLSAAPRIPAITWEETANACAISKAEWGRWQPSPKYRRITFSCRGCSIRRISDMRFRSIWVTSFQHTAG